MKAYLAKSLDGVDVGIDGRIDNRELDRLLWIVAALPGRFGHAASGRAEYGTVQKRAAARMVMFDAIAGTDDCQPRGKTAMGQFVQWPMQHWPRVVAAS